MSQYPTFDDYQVALSAPDRFFTDPEITRRRVIRDNRGFPHYAAGGFAITFKFIGSDGQGPIAVRCFKQEIPDLIQRYTAIENFLRQLKSDLFVDFAVSAPSGPGVKAGVFVRGRWLPTMRMDWVEGSVLGAAVEKRLGSPSQLGMLRQELLRYARLSEKNGFAHGDIHPDNILVTSAGSLRFVDYDGMFVQSLSGLRSPVAGQPDYQSPVRSREPGAFDVWLDRFPLLVLDLSLAALQADPTFFQRRTGDGLLLSRADFDAPERSHLLAAIGQIRGLRETVRVFQSACRMPLQQVPTLDDFRATEGSSRGPQNSAKRSAFTPNGFNVAPVETLRRVQDKVSNWQLGDRAVMVLAGCAALIAAAIYGPSRIYYSVQALFTGVHYAVVSPEHAYVYIRTGPGTQFSHIDAIPKGTHVSIIRSKGAWSEVRTGTYTSESGRRVASSHGYINSNLLTPP